MGQDLVPEITPVDEQSARLPAPLVVLEHGRRDDLEERVFGPGGRGLAPPDRGQHFGRAGPRFGHVEHAEIAHYLPDSLAAMLAMEEEALPSRGRHPDAEALEFGVADVV